MISATAHEKAVRDLPCAVSRLKPVTVHHCHGASLLDLGITKGMALRSNPFLIIPLHAKYHVGDCGIDYGVGVETWESRYGTQVEHLEWVSAELGYDVFQLAREYLDVR